MEVRTFVRLRTSRLRSISATIVADRDPIIWVVWALAVAATCAELALRPSAFASGAGASATPFLILAAVIAGAAVADRAGVFRRLARAFVPGSAPPRPTVAAVLLFTALLSGLVNLDVAVVIAVPVALGVARRTGVSGGWLAVAVALTANATSFLLPTSNVTTLLVLSSSPAGVSNYLGHSWIPWILTTSLTVIVLSLLVPRGRASDGGEIPAGGVGLGAIVDLVPMFLVASAIRGVIAGGISLHGPFLEQVTAGSMLAAGLNNLPAAAAVRSAGPAGSWAAILAMGLGPNLLLTGSVATLISRRLARGGGASLRAGRFTVLGGVLLPLQLGAAMLGLRLAGVLR
jgi:arsenical pump membrane protein